MTKQSIEQLQQSIDALQKQLDALAAAQQTQKLEIATSKVSMWKPEDDGFFFIESNGRVDSYGVHAAVMVRTHHEEGNCFPSESLAEYYAKRRAARQRLEMLALAENGMVPYEWTVNCPNFYLTTCSDISIDQHCTVREDHQYFPTKKAAQRVLDAMTDDDLVILFGTANRGGK